MTTISKLAIKGVRSFGVDRDDEQKIEFSSPLTLIVGQNGCGKTTIIECLKYALTGDKPPGTDGGKTFVHDPKICKLKIAMGQVKLTATNANQIKKTVVRSMRSEVLKTGKTKFETLDSTICTEDPYKGRDDVTGRVDDINNNMCEFMGVSKAIINNVIFCHQEDSNWPLDEGKKLKEKFDAIFGTTEYNKAIEKIQKIRKNYCNQLDLKNAEKKLFAEYKSQAEAKERTLNKIRNEYKDAQEGSKKAEDSLEPLEKRKYEILEIEKNLCGLVTKRNNLISVVSQKDAEYKRLKGKLKRELTGTIEELEQQNKRFLEDQKEKQTRMEILEVENREINKKERELQQAVSALMTKSEGVTEKIGKLQDLSAERFDKVRKICKKLNIEFEGDDLDQSILTQEVDSIYEEIKRTIQEEEENLEMMKIEADHYEFELQKKIDKLREDRTKLKTQIFTQNNSLENFDVNCKKLKSEIKLSEDSIPMLNELNPKIAKTELKLKELNKKDNTAHLNENYEIAEAEKIEIEDQLSILENDIEILQKASKLTSELEIKKTDLNRDIKEFDKLKNKLLPNLRNLFGKNIPDANYRVEINAKKESLKEEVKTIKEKLNKLQREQDRSVDRRKNLKKDLECKQNNIKKIKDDIEDVCNGNDYLSYLQAQNEKVAKLSMELAVLQSSKNTYSNYIAKIDEDPCCPLCHKNFENDESDVLRVELQESIHSLPKKIDGVQKKLNIEKKLYDKINSYKSSYDNITKYEEEISKMEKEEKEIKETLEKNSENFMNEEKQLIEPEALYNIIISSSFVAEAFKLDDLQRAIDNKKKEVQNLNDKLPNNIPKKSLEEAQRERKKLSDLIKSKNEMMKKIDEENKKFTNEKMSLREQLNSMISEKNKFQEKMQGIDRLKEQLIQLKSEKQECEKKLKECLEKLNPIESNLQKVNDEKDKARKDNKTKLEEYQKKLKEINNDKIEIERDNREISLLKEMKLENQLEALKSLENQYKKKIDLFQKKYTEKSNEITAIRNDIANQETTHRNLTDNIELRRIEGDRKNACDELESMEKNIGELDINTMKQEKIQINAKIDRLNKVKNTLLGKLGKLEEDLKIAEEEMNNEKYKNAKSNYMKVIHQTYVLSATIADLSNYRSALEKSLLQFHQDKMDQINHLLRELWNNIYRGNDIDYIMIKTDADQEMKAVASDKKRSYNYRVVQSKNGAEVDMRGRCSAGQKVLASLIIRIALAEVFSANCGILALDEPTTNLDSKNISSLCDALSQIIQERDDGSGKFMLLVITHDEDFANNLERADFYWKLSRDNKGCSRIEKCSNN